MPSRFIVPSLVYSSFKMTNLVECTGDLFEAVKLNISPSFSSVRHERYDNHTCNNAQELAQKD